MKTWTILMNLDEEILRMMKDARWIYDQALYHQRQKFFETRKEGKIKTFSFKELYHIISQTDEYKSMRLDSVSKSGALRQLFSNWNGYIRSVMQYKKHPEKFLKRPKLPNYICRGRNSIWYKSIRQDFVQKVAVKMKSDYLTVMSR